LALLFINLIMEFLTIYHDYIFINILFFNFNLNLLLHINNYYIFLNNDKLY